MSPADATANAFQGQPTGRARAQGTPWPLFSAYLRNILLTKKTPLLFLVLMIPFFVTLAVYPSLDGSYYTFEGTEAPPGQGGILWFEDATMIIFLGALVPFVTAFYATGLIGDEVQNKTLPYLFTRPVRRFEIYLAKYAAFLVGVFTLTAVALIAMFFLATSATQNPWSSFGELNLVLSVLLLAVAANGALFGLFGVLFRYPIIAAIVYILLWENIVGNFPAEVKRYTIGFYEKAIITNQAERTNFVDEFLRLTVSTPAAIFILIGITVALVALAAFVVSTKDYNV